MDITGGLGALKSGFEISNAIRQRVKEGKVFPNEILEQLQSVQQAMLDSQAALNEAATEIRSLEEKLARRDRDDETGKDLEYSSDGGFYVRKSEQAQGKGIPYCPVCWGSDKKLVPLNPGSGNGYFSCDIHDSNYQTERHRQWLKQQNSSGRRQPYSGGY
jgi:hypothetical protein